jgi:hypothetical protein
MPIHRLVHKSVDNRVKHFDTTPTRFARRRYIFVAVERLAQRPARRRPCRLSWKVGTSTLKLVADSRINP